MPFSDAEETEVRLCYLSYHIPTPPQWLWVDTFKAHLGTVEVSGEIKSGMKAIKAVKAP
jgi:hypothetical protein